MFLGRKNQYCENDYTIKHSLQIQCDPYQMAFFTELEQKILKFVCKHKSLQTAKAVLRKKQQSWRTSNYIPKLQSSKQYDIFTKHTEINGTG